jgi:uncharacterized protein YggE
MRLLLTPALLGAALAAPIAATAETPILPDATVLDVSATGHVARVPDLATIRAGVVTQQATAAAALSSNAERMARVLATLRAAGIAERDIATSSVSLQPQYRYADGQAPTITGYQASNTVSVRFRDIAKSGAGLDALVKAGANQIEGPTLSIDKADEALDAARSDAIARARARATLYAQAAGLRVERIVSIAENAEDAGGRPPMPVYMARAKADSAPTELAPGETDVTTTVSVRFLLK